MKLLKPVKKNKRIVYIFFVVATILLVPFTAMQFSNEVKWTLLDFIVAGCLLLCTGLLCEVALRKIHSKKNRMIFCFFAIVLQLLIWIELAVGI